MISSHFELRAPWKRLLLVMLYSLPPLSLLCTYQGGDAEAQDLPQVKIPSAIASDDGQWRIAPKDYANLRHSELDQITLENSKNPHVAFTFSTGVTQGHEAAPLVVDNTMYIVTPYPNYLYALDLTQPGAPVKWQYELKPAAAAQGVACCDQVSREAAYANGRIFYNTLDGHTVAVDAQTGKEVWKTKLGDINKGHMVDEPWA
jgi:glucose dehydrogenase